MIRVEHRGYSASLIGTTMTIRDWNGNIAARDKWWKYTFAGDPKEKLREAIDDLIRLGPYIRKSWWSEVTG